MYTNKRAKLHTKKHSQMHAKKHSIKRGVGGGALFTDLHTGSGHAQRVLGYYAMCITYMLYAMYCILYAICYVLYCICLCLRLCLCNTFALIYILPTLARCNLCTHSILYIPNDVYIVHIVHVLCILALPFAYVTCVIYCIN